MTPAIDRAERAFIEAFGVPADVVARAPGRVNLIGEHTDYNDGFVLPAAISGQSVVAARRRTDGLVQVVASDFQGARDSFALAEPIGHNPDAPWASYVRGMALALRDAGLPMTGADLLIAGDIPRGAGLSSSASLCVGIGVALSGLTGLDPADPTQIARLAQQAESAFVGTRCGIMDQLASARGEAGHALLIDCRSLVCQPVHVPDDVAILIVHSGVERGLVDGAYNERRAQCETAAAALGVAALRDASLDALNAARTHLDTVVFRRARHVITENARTLAAAKALASADLVSLGQCMAASHASMRDDFEITVPAVDELVAIVAEEIGPVGGARMTGGGFGGAVVALLPMDRLDAVVGAVRRRYRTPAGETPLILMERPCQGAGLVR